MLDSSVTVNNNNSTSSKRKRNTLHEETNIELESLKGKTIEEIRKHQFWFVDFESWCRVEDGRPVPCEIGISVSTLEGEVTSFHRFIASTQINPWFLKTANYTAKNIHGIPHSVLEFEGNILESNPQKLWNEIITFLSPLLSNPSLYMYAKDKRLEVDSFKELALRAGSQDTISSRIRDVDSIVKFLAPYSISKSITFLPTDIPERELKCRFHYYSDLSLHCALADSRQNAISLNKLTQRVLAPTPNQKTNSFSSEKPGPVWDDSNVLWGKET